MAKRKRAQEPKPVDPMVVMNLLAGKNLGSDGAGRYGHLLDLEMLALTPRGRERTRAEFGSLLKQSGFKLRRVVPTAGYVSIVEGVKP